MSWLWASSSQHIKTGALGGEQSMLYHPMERGRGFRAEDLGRLALNQDLMSRENS